MLKHPELTKGRLCRFQRELQKLVHPESCALTDLSVFSAPGRISYEDAIRGEFRAAREGEVFGPGWSTHWFRISYCVPKEWEGQEVLFQFYSASEGCVWQDGVPLQGLTSYNWGPQDIRSHFKLHARAAGGESGTLYVEAAINGLFGLGDLDEKKADQLGELRHAAWSRAIVRRTISSSILRSSKRWRKSWPHRGRMGDER